MVGTALHGSHVELMTAVCPCLVSSLRAGAANCVRNVLGSRAQRGLLLALVWVQTDLGAAPGMDGETEAQQLVAQ